MNLRRFLGDTKQLFAESDSKKKALLKTGMNVFNGLNFTVTSRVPFGTNVFSEEWDLLVVLDACRVDAMREVADEYEFIDTVDKIWSVGSSSHEWTVQTFDRQYSEEVSETALFSSNPFASETLVDGHVPPYDASVPLGSLAWDPVSADQFAYFEQVSVEGTGLSGTVPASKITDRVIDETRAHDYNRLIAHYFQPHRPFLSRTDDPATESEVVFDRPYDEYEAGNITFDELWEAYLENLRAVLDSVGLLLENVDAERVVITADHGQLITELGVTGHPEGFPHPVLKQVPWVETTATDSGTYTPRRTQSEPTEDLEQRLEHLGYV